MTSIGQNTELKQRDTLSRIGSAGSYRDQHGRGQSGPIFVVCLVDRLGDPPRQKARPSDRPAIWARARHAAAGRRCPRAAPLIHRRSRNEATGAEQRQFLAAISRRQIEIRYSDTKQSDALSRWQQRANEFDAGLAQEIVARDHAPGSFGCG